LTFKFQGRHYRLTDVFGNVVKPVVAGADSAPQQVPVHNDTQGAEKRKSAGTRLPAGVGCLVSCFLALQGMLDTRVGGFSHSEAPSTPGTGTGKVRAILLITSCGGRT